jgi:hypothetical protein
VVLGLAKRSIIGLYSENVRKYITPDRFMQTNRVMEADYGDKFSVITSNDLEDPKVQGT